MIRLAHRTPVIASFAAAALVSITWLALATIAVEDGGLGAGGMVAAVANSFLALVEASIAP